MTDSRNKGGRPRKDDATKKARRVQIAMTDSEYADARRLAQLLDTTVSSALATYAVPVSLRSKLLEDFAERLKQELTKAALRSANDRRTLDAAAETPDPSGIRIVDATEFDAIAAAVAGDRDQQPLNSVTIGQDWHDVPRLFRYVTASGRALILVEFVGSERAHRELKTPTQKLYDDAIAAFAKEQARVWSEVFTQTGKDYDVAKTPYTESAAFVLFGFNVQQMTGRLYSYGDPLRTDEVLHSDLSTLPSAKSRHTFE